MCIRESKCEVDGETIMKENGGARLSKGVASSTDGRSRGIMI